MNTFLQTVIPAIVSLALLGGGPAAGATAGQTELQTHSAAMLKNADDMVAHGGMGDAKAIVHHCGEVRKEAQQLLELLPSSDPHGQAAIAPLKDTIRYCDRVAQLGEHVDPGVTLNPATKARSAAREAARHLAAISASSR